MGSNSMSSTNKRDVMLHQKNQKNFMTLTAGVDNTMNSNLSHSIMSPTQTTANPKKFTSASNMKSQHQTQ